MRYDFLKHNTLRELRNERKLSEKQVAEVLRIAQNTLSQYELGERNIPTDVLIQASLFYETSIDYLLGLTEERKPYKRKKYNNFATPVLPVKNK